MKLIILLCTSLLLTVSPSSITVEDPFQDVIDATEDPIIRKKLIAFREGGIEKEVDVSNYDVEEVISYSKTFLGTPHQMRGASKKGIDCSGLMMVVHRQVGVKLPHSSHEQARYGRVIAEKDQLKRGDLVFFYNSYNTTNFITHAGLYLGENEFIHASSSKGVIISSMDDTYWKTRYLFATRFK